MRAFIIRPARQMMLGIRVRAVQVVRRVLRVQSVAVFLRRLDSASER